LVISTLARQSVCVRRQGKRMSRAMQFVLSQVINEDEDNVRTARGRCGQRQ
jgi:hypothetical protein